MGSILVRSARVIDCAEGLDGVRDILVKDGAIAAVQAGLQAQADQVIDARGLVAAPGLVDMHVHLRDPGFTYKEDIFTGCAAAAAGGVTSLLAMPNTAPPVDTPETVQYILSRAQQADARVYTAACITKGMKSGELCDLQALKDAGAVAVSDDGRPVENAALMAQAMRQAADIGLAVVSHCEDLSLAKGGIMNQGACSVSLGVNGIPAAAEDTGTAREIALAAAYGVPVHICHVSTATSVALIRDAKARGIRVTAETAPHYFALTDKLLMKKDADYRMNPPLRSEIDRIAVIKGLRDGTLDAIATDHAPHSREEKADFYKAPNGSVGLETSLAAGITFLVKEHHLTLGGLLEKMSLTPAGLLGIPAGTLRPGANADIVLFDENEQWTVQPEKLHGKSANTPFKGMTLTGRVKYTVCRGRIVFCCR